MWLEKNHCLKLAEMVIFCNLLVLVVISPFNVRSKICMSTSCASCAPFHVRSKIAPHMERSNADFAPDMERRHSFRDQKFIKSDIFASFQRLFKPAVFRSLLTDPV